MTLRTLYIIFAGGVLGVFALTAMAGWEPPSIDMSGSGGGGRSGGYRSYGGSGWGK